MHYALKEMPPIWLVTAYLSASAIRESNIYKALHIFIAIRLLQTPRAYHPTEVVTAPALSKCVSSPSAQTYACSLPPERANFFFAELSTAFDVIA